MELVQTSGSQSLYSCTRGMCLYVSLAHTDSLRALDPTEGHSIVMLQDTQNEQAEMKC